MRMTGKKFCPTCKKDKPVIEFPASKKSDDGLWYECRVCHNDRNIRNRDARNKRVGKKPPSFYDVTYPMKD